LPCSLFHYTLRRNRFNRETTTNYHGSYHIAQFLGFIKRGMHPRNTLNLMGQPPKVALGMKSDSLMSLLVALLFANTAATAILSFQYVNSIGQQQRLLPQVNRDQKELAFFQALWNEALEYGKKNPEIRPLLQPLGLKTNASPGATPEGAIKSRQLLTNGTAAPSAPATSRPPAK
jgi:hypothetical protein